VRWTRQAEAGEANAEQGRQGVQEATAEEEAVRGPATERACGRPEIECRYRVGDQCRHSLAEVEDGVATCKVDTPFSGHEGFVEEHEET